MLNVLQNISEEQLLACQRRRPKLSDLDLISIRLTAEYPGFDSEKDLFRKWAKVITLKIQPSRIKLNIPKRTNQYNYKKQPYVLRKSRKRTETLFSQLGGRFMTRRNDAGSLEGFKTRILPGIITLTVVQYINKFFFDRNINNIKINII